MQMTHPSIKGMIAIATQVFNSLKANNTVVDYHILFPHRE